LKYCGFRHQDCPSLVVVPEKTTDGTRRELAKPDPDVERWIF
jgi:hypothetical protein